MQTRGRKSNKNIMKEIKIGEKYQLKQDKDYFCIDLQRCVRFTSPVCVEVVGTVTGNLSDPDRLYFGKLISIGSVGADYVSDNEIEFIGDDVVDVYTMKKAPIFYLEISKD